MSLFVESQSHGGVLSNSIWQGHIPPSADMALFERFKSRMRHPGPLGAVEERISKVRTGKQISFCVLVREAIQLALHD